jgi:hypothetical protein
MGVGCWVFVVFLDPSISWLGWLLILGGLFTAGSLIVGGIAFQRRQRYVPLARRKTPQDSLRARLERRRKNRNALISRLVRPLEDKMSSSPFFAQKYSTLSHWFFIVYMVILATVGLLGFLWLLFIVGSETGGLIYFPLTMIAFFVLLFAGQFLPFRKLKYALFAAIPVGGVVILGFFIDLIAL